MVGELLRDHLRPYLAGTELDVDLVAEFYTSAALGVLTWWVNQGFPYPPRQVATMYQTLATPGILAAVRATTATAGAVQ